MKGSLPDRPQSVQRRLLLNSASGMILFVINVVVVFLLSPVIVRQLGNRDYGIWDLLLSFCGYLGLLEVGVGPAIIRFVARSTALDDPRETQRVFVTSAVTLIFAGSVSLAIMLFTSINPYRIFNVPPAESPHLRILCILAGCNLLLQFSGTTPVAFLMGIQKHYQVNTARAILTAGSGVATYFALTSAHGNGLLWMSLILLSGNLLQYGLFAVWAMRVVAAGGLSPRLFSTLTLKSLFSFGVNSSFLMLADRIQRQSVPFVIGHVLGVAYIVFYSIPSRLIEYGMSLVVAVGLPITPLFSAVEARSGLTATRRSWLDTSRWMQILMLWISAGLGILGKDFIGIWMGPQYADRGKWIVIFLSADMFVAAMAPNSARLLIALDKHGQVALKLVGISVLAVFAASLTARDLGLPGVALVICLANIAGFVLCWHKACTCLKMSAFQHLRSILTSTMPPVVVFAIVLAGLNALAKPGNYLFLAAQALAATVFYLPAVWFLAVDASERRRIAHWITQKARRPADKAARTMVS